MDSYDCEILFYHSDIKYYSRYYDLSTKIPWKKQRKTPKKKRNDIMNEIMEGYKKMACHWYNALSEEKKESIVEIDITIYQKK